MTYRTVFVDAVRRLASAPHPTETPELDARVLLGHTAGLSHAALLARWSEPVAPAFAQRFAAVLQRRLEGEPVAWITGSKEFLGMDFEVEPGVLVPRPDTETLVESALEILPPASPSAPRRRVVDVCTGTGCVAVGLAALASRGLEVWACDLSPAAVAVARRNSRRLLAAERQIQVVESDLLARLPGTWDLIVSNPPYLTPDETRERVSEGGWREPSLALDGGGADGLDLIRRLVAQAVPVLRSDGWLLIEAADAQMDALLRTYAAHGLTELRTWTDLAGQRRVAGGRKPL